MKTRVLFQARSVSLLVRDSHITLTSGTRAVCGWGLLCCQVCRDLRWNEWQARRGRPQVWHGAQETPEKYQVSYQELDFVKQLFLSVFLKTPITSKKLIMILLILANALKKFRINEILIMLLKFLTIHRIKLLWNNNTRYLNDKLRLWGNNNITDPKSNAVIFTDCITC